MFVSPESSPGRNFYPRPPRGGRQRGCGEPQGSNQFLSTPSARRATDVKATAYNKALISIHALREEGDAERRWSESPATNFYPRPPRGGRPASRARGVGTKNFLSTPSARRATLSIWTSQSSFCISIHALREEGDLWPHPPSRRCRISIHALREEGDRKGRTAELPPCDFYPRPPRGGRLPR